MKLNYNDKKSRVAAKIAILAMLFCGMSSEVSAQQVTISNNLLYDAWLTPNLRVGVRLAPHWSAGLTAGYNPWPSDENKSRKWKHLLVSPSVRYWTDSVNVRHFFGVNLIYSHYNVADVKFPFGLYKSVRDERRQGDLGALGVFYGYSWPIARHWNIEALIGAAVPIEPVQPVVETQPVVPEPPVVKEPEPVKERAIDVLVRTEPVLAHISDYKPYDRSQVLRRDQRALFVYFPVAKSDIQTEFRDNQQTLNHIIDVTQKMLADKDSEIRKIQIVGLASFDGKNEANERLASNRAYALKKYIQDRLAVSDDQFDVACGGEDWADFRDQVAESIANGSDHAAALQKVIDIIDHEPDLARREQQIRKLNGGRTFQYIKEQLLADQRNSGYLRIYFFCRLLVQ